jgi:hypothetical protein
VTVREEKERIYLRVRVYYECGGKRQKIHRSSGIIVISEAKGSENVMAEEEKVIKSK